MMRETRAEGVKLLRVSTNMKVLECNNKLTGVTGGTRTAQTDRVAVA